MTASVRRLLPSLLLAAACAATGGLAALTAHPPDVAIAIWPPAGIALAALAARGRHLWPGVWVGVFAVLVPTAARFDAGVGPTGLVAAAALVATGYAAQAAAGAWLLRRALGDPLRLVHAREIALFLAVAGPVHTVPVAVLAAAVVCGYGVHPWADFASVWVGWWWNDVLGGLLFAPITLTLVGTPRELWGPRWRTVGAPLAAVVLVTAGLFLAARDWDAHGPRERLQAEADRAAEVLRADVDRLLQGMDDVRRGNNLPAALRTTTGRTRVRSDLRMLRAACPTARGVAVYEAVPADRRAELEAAYRRVDSRLADFRVTEWTPDGGRTTAADRDRYLVAVQANPVPESYAALGLDLLSVPGVRAAFDRAVDEDRPVAVRPGGYDPVLCPADGVLVIRPFYGHPQPADPAGRRADVRGALVAVFDRTAVPDILSAGRDPRVRFVLAGGGDGPAPPAPPGAAVATARVELTGLPVELRAGAGPEFVAAHRTRYAWAAVAGGVGLGVLAAAWLLAMSGRAAAVDEEVARRTAELARQVEARELTEAALRASEARLAEAQRIARLGYWEWDPVTGEGYWCGVSEDLLGVAAGDPADPAGPDLLALVHPDDRPRFEQTARAVVATGARGELEFRVVRPGGAERWVQAWLQATDADGLFLVQGTLQDVTDRKEAELALRASEARLADAQRIARIGCWELDPVTGAGWWSAEMYRLFGRDPAAGPPTFEGFLAAVHPDDRVGVLAFHAAAVRDGALHRHEYRIVADGAVRHVRGDVQLVRAADGAVARVTGTTQDVTDRVRAEEDRRQFDERLQQTQKLEGLGVLAGGIAHDFNNLLTGVLGNASLAREVVPAESDLHEYLRPIEQAAAHAASLCQQMLAYAGKGATVRGTFHLNQLIGDTADLLRLSASRKVDLRFDLAEDVPVLDGDASQIRQVLLNLVTNASEAVGAGAGVIEVSTGWGRVGCGRAGVDGHRCADLAPGGYAWVQVRDTGSGMPPDVVRRIFDPFFTTKFTGRGLGLSAVHGIAKSHGGAVCVDSTPGVGTTFRVYLAVPAEDLLARTPPPVVHTPARIAPPHRRTPFPGDPTAGVAVVADDDPAVRQLVAVALHSLGFEVRSAENGAEAVDLVREGGLAVRVVVLDVVMPVMDGREAAAEVRAERPDLPVIVMSGYSEPDVTRQFAGGLVAGFVQKPFRPVDLTACVRRAVARAARPTGVGL